MNNETILENYYEEGLALGMTEVEAGEYAYKMMEDNQYV
jgi:hypothetical protein